jgi:hypothetical protein
MGYRNPQLWLPPQSAIQQLAKLINAVLLYMLTAGCESVPLLDFAGTGCFEKLPDGKVEYNLGPDAHIQNPKDILVHKDATLLNKLKTALIKTCAKKRPAMFTPRKDKTKLPKHAPSTSIPNKYKQ